MSINLASRQSAITTDSSNVTHIVWVEDSYLWHATYDDNSATWVDAEAVALVPDQDITNISLVYDDKLIKEGTTNNSQPGFTAVWQQGNDNDSDFYYSAAQYDENGNLEWLANPQAITSDNVGDFEPRALVYNNEVLLVGSKSNVANSANQSIREDSDLYYQQFSVNSDLFTTENTTLDAPNAPYEPQTTIDGVIQGLIPVQDNNSSVNTLSSFASTSESVSTNALLASSKSSSGSSFIGVGFGWNTGISFDTGLLKALKAINSVPTSGLLRTIIDGFFSKVKISGDIKGGQSPAFGNKGKSSLFLSAKAKITLGLSKTINKPVPGLDPKKYATKESAKSPFSISLTLDSKWQYEDSSPYALKNITDTITFSGALKFPIIPSAEDGGLFTADLSGSVGLSIILKATPKPGSDFDPSFQTSLQTLYSEIGVSLVGGIVGLATGGGASGALLGIVGGIVLSTIRDFIIDATLRDSLDITASISFPILTGSVDGKVGLSWLNINASAGASAGLTWGIGDAPNSQFLNFPISANVQIGPIITGVSVKPGWKWEALNSDDSASASTQSSLTASSVSNALFLESDTSSNEATVTGSLLTVDLGETLDPNNIPDASQFTVQVTDLQGNVTTIPVFQITVQGSTVQLRLNEIIPPSANYDYTTSDNPTPKPDLIEISYTLSQNGQDNLTDSQGNIISSFSDLSVTNKTPDTFSSSFNPVSGNSQNYANTNDELVLNFATPLSTNVIPDYRRFTVTGATVESLTVESNAIILQLNQTVNNATVTYNSQDTSLGNLLLSNNNEAIANFIINSDINVNDSQFVLGLNSPQSLNTRSVPNVNQFTVNIVDSQGNILNTIGVNKVNVLGNNVNLYLQEAIAENQLYTVTYAEGSNTSTNLQQSGGTPINGFTVSSTATTGITTSELTAILITDNDGNSTFNNTLSNYAVTLVDAEGNTVNSPVNIQSVQTKSSGVELIVEQNITTSQNVKVNYNNNQIQVSSLVTGIETPAISTSTAIANVEADLGQDSTPALALTKTGEVLVAWVAEVPPIKPIAGFVNGDVITLNFVQNLNADSVPTASQFTVTDQNGTNYTIDGNPSLLGNSVTLNLNNPVADSAQLIVTYNLSADKNIGNLFLTDATNSRLWIDDFSDFSLTNTNGNTNPPILLGAGAIVNNVSGQNVNRITLVFDQNLTGNPVENQFVIESNGVNFELFNEPTVNGNTVTLNVIPPTSNNLIGAGDIVTVNYTTTVNGMPVSSQQQLTGTNGTVIDFSNQPVITSPTEPTTVIKYGFGPSGDALLSAPSSIIGSDGLNFYPVAALDQNQNNVVAWVHADMSDIPTNFTPGDFYTDDQTNIINESLAQSDIYYSVYDAATLQWSIAAPIISQTGAEGKIALGMGANNELIAAWLNYNNDESQIFWSSLDYSSGTPTWSTPQLLYADANPDPLTELQISNLNGETAVFWTETQSTSYTQLTTEAEPLLYFRLDETSGTSANNDGIYSYLADGTYSGTVTFNEMGALEDSSNNTGDTSPAILFAGGASMTLPQELNPQAFSGNSFSLDFWVKAPASPSETLNLVSMAGLFGVSLNSSLGLTLNIDNQTISSTQSLVLNEWYYVVATYDGQADIATLYLNGQPLASQDNIDLTLPESTNITLAGGNSSIYLDEVAFYNEVLSYSDAVPSNLNSNDITNLNGYQLGQLMMGGGNEIGNKYASQYVEPLTPGANTYYAIIDGNSSSATNNPSQIEPSYKITPTQLSNANKPTWDIVSYSSANTNGYVNPNGTPDIYLPLILQNQQTGTKINSLVVTAKNSSDTTLTWSIGTGNGNQLGVAQGDKLLNPINPDGSFNYTILSPNVELSLFVDPGTNNPSDLSDFQYSINGKTFVSFNPVSGGSSTLGSTQVLGTATVTEANDSSLALIDSGFIVNTNNPAIGYVLANGDVNGDGKTDVIVGNRGYTDTNGMPLDQGGTVQILFGGGTVLTDNGTNPLTPTDLSGNSDGILIQGIVDGGLANSDYPVSLALGDVDGDGIDDLVMGAPNVNNGNGAFYVIKGSYIKANPAATITINSNNNTLSDTKGTASATIGYGKTSNDGENTYFGFSVAVGNLNGTGEDDIAVGEPGYTSGNGAIWLYFDGATFASKSVTTSNGEAFGYTLGISSAEGGKSFTGQTKYDDLIVGYPLYTQNVNNQWAGADNLPSDNQNLFNSNSPAAIGKVAIYNNSNGFAPDSIYTYIGSNSPSTNGTAEDALAGSSLASDDWDGDGIKDLAISAPGIGNNTGVVYVLKGGNPTQATNQDLDTVSNLIILGSLPSGEAGTVITTVGDVNGDKYEDFLITAPNGANGAGQSYVLFGPLNLEEEATLFDLNITGNDNKTTFLLNGSQSYQLAGSGASAIGDVNNDGVDDLMVTAPNAQQLYSVYGHQWLADDGSIKLADISGDNGFVTDGDLYLGITNGSYTLGLSNFFDSTILGVPRGVLYIQDSLNNIIWYSNNTTPAVQALMQTDGNFVLYSQSQPVDQPGSTEFAVFSTETQGNSGAYLSLATDGGLYILGSDGSILNTLNSGSASPTTNNVTLLEANQIIQNTTLENPNGILNPPLIGNGNDVVMLGDINGDGFADVLSGGSQYGAVIIFGNSTKDLLDEAAGTNDLIVTVQGANIQQVTNLGDYNGDGLNDFGVLDSAEHLYVVFGSETLGSLGTLTLTPSSSQYVSTGGESQVTGGIGDYNGDGYDDFLLLNYIQLGGATFDANRNFEVQTIGILMTPVSDINGDGYSDLIQQQSKNLETSTSMGYSSDSSFNSLNLVLGNSTNNSNPTPQNYLSQSAQPFNGTLNGKNINSAGDFNGDGIADTMVSTAQPAGLIVVETSDSQISYAYFDPFVIDWNNDSQVPLGVQTTTHTYTTSDETMGLASYDNDWYFAHSEDYIFWLSGSNINQSGENQFGPKYDYAKPQLVTVKDNLYMIIADWNLNDPFISIYNSSNNSWSAPNPSTEQNDLTNFITDTNGNDVVVAGVGDKVYIAWTHQSNLYYGYWDTSNSTYTQINNIPLISLGVSGDNDPLSMTAVNGVIYIALRDSSNKALMSYYNTNGSSSWSSAQNILYVQGSQAVQAEENSVTLMGLNGEVYATWYDTNKITSQSQTADTQYVYVTKYNPNESSPAWSNSLLLQNSTANTPLDITGNGDFPGLTPFAWSATTSVVLGNTNANASNLVSIYGLTGDFSEFSASNPTQSNYSSLGNEISSIGDINGDGFDDILITAPNYNNNEGGAFVVFGTDSTESINLQDLTANQNNSGNESSTQGFSITGLPGSLAGISASGGEDVNGDGFDDFIIGAPGANDNLTYVIFGSDFNNTVSQTGTIGDDVMLGTPTGESFVAGQGDDQIYSNGGLDVVYAGPGDDFVTVNDTYFRRLDGGTGTDVLKFTGYNGQDWDLTTLSPGLRLQNFEILVTEDYGANTLTLNSLTVTQLSSNNTVTVVIDENDTLNLSNDFSYSGKVYQYNQQFTEYKSSTSAAKVLVNFNQVTKNATHTNTPASILTPETNTAQSVAIPATSLATQSFSTNDSDVILTEEISTLETELFANAVTTEPLANNAPTRIYVSNPTANEADGEIDFTIKRTGDLSKYVQVSYLTKDGRGKAGNDYLPTYGKVVFAPNETSKTVAVPLPLDDIYTGTRDFGLLVTLEQESTQPITVQFNVYADPGDEQIRVWSHKSDSTLANSLTQGNLEFRSTTTDGKADIKIYFDNINEFNAFYIFNPETAAYENFKINGSEKAELFDEEQDGNFDGAILHLQDGGKFDIGQTTNGLVYLRGFFASVNTINGTPGPDTIIGTDLDDIIVGSQGRDTLTGGGGSDRFVYNSIIESGDTITDFTPGFDKIDLSAVLDGLGYTGSYNAIADEVVRLRSLGSDTLVQIDPDGLGSVNPVSFIRVLNVSVTDMNNVDNFVL